LWIFLKFVKILLKVWTKKLQNLKEFQCKSHENVHSTCAAYKFSFSSVTMMNFLIHLIGKRIFLIHIKPLPSTLTPTNHVPHCKVYKHDANNDFPLHLEL
jgi:hypothetical protein